MDTLTIPATVDQPAMAPETTKPLKLSEAIRLGAMATDQAFGTFGDGTHTCGIGAAQVALGLTPQPDDELNMMLEHAGPVRSPCADRRHGSVRETIIHLNDDHKLPREKIADWLESLGL